MQSTYKATGGSAVGAAMPQACGLASPRLTKWRYVWGCSEGSTSPSQQSAQVHAWHAP
jgi:hypothetical protein